MEEQETMVRWLPLAPDGWHYRCDRDGVWLGMAPASEGPWKGRGLWTEIEPLLKHRLLLNRLRREE